jgi:crotonobetainyl-CoA:carnitine CoA-transferase CaiB-like acyl-CoA transferase
MADPTPAPAIGQHTAQVLAEVLGYDAQRIAGLAEGGAFGTRVPRGAENPA